MSATTIEWADKSSNPLRAFNLETGKNGTFCVHVSPGCASCYAGRMNTWRGNGLDFIQPNAKRVRFELNEKELRSWLRLKPGVRVFPFDMCDLFYEGVPDELIDRCFAAMALSDATFMVLTKRAKRMNAYFNEPLGFSLRREGRVLSAAYQMFLEQPNRSRPKTYRRPAWPLPNVWLGTSCEDQQRADERIPLLLQTPAAVRFLSCEPLLGRIELCCVSGWETAYAARWLGRPILGADGIQWVIAGGESGPKARPMHPDWARSLRDQCSAVGVPFFFKQWGEWAPQGNPHEDRSGLMSPVGEFSELSKLPHGLGRGLPTPGYAYIFRAGKKRNGRILDGRTWDEFPEARS
jgi:protein gp37